MRYRAAVFAILLLDACTSSSAQRIGSASYPPLAAATDVVVYTSEAQIKKPYQVIGIVSYDNPGKFRVLDLSSAIEPLKEKARKLGANAIIINKSQPVKSGSISTGIYAEARAVRLTQRSSRHRDED